LIGRGAPHSLTWRRWPCWRKTRIPPVDIETLPDDLREALEEQRKLRGAPLYPYLFYARNPAFFRAAQGMLPAALVREVGGIRPGDAGAPEGHDRRR
jgi:hypothetical protein